MNKDENKKPSIFDIASLFAVLGILGNTILLIMFQNTWTYEEVEMFEKTPKSNFDIIMQYNPIFAIVYVSCGAVLLLDMIYRLIRYTKDRLL